jgi:UDP-N-acetylmuramate dehydrogenase
MMSAMGTKGHDVPRGKLLTDEPMVRHTSWRVGGPADRLYLPADLDDLGLFLKTLPPGEPLYWVGLGSNLLVRDGGLRGTVIMTSGALSGLGTLGEEALRAEAGVACAKAARYSVSHGLVGAEFLAGIPGTVGGALAMNAGAFGGETWNIVHSVETIDRSGTVRTRPLSDYRVSYRHVEPVNSLGDEWFVAAHFKLAKGEQSKAKTLIKSLLARRGATQPTQLPNAGSVFKNPPNDFAARLIEASGLKGLREGNACVSELHANFIVNLGGARAADIERLISRVQMAVQAQHGLRLEPEVRVIGDAS